MTDRLSEILGAYKFWDDWVKKKSRQIQRLRDAESSTAITYSDTPKGSGGHTLADYAVKLEELEEDLRELRGRRGEAYDRIFSLIVRMHSGAQIDIIYRRYILLQTWPEICRGRDISKASAMDCHRLAIANLEKILDPTSTM